MELTRNQRRSRKTLSSLSAMYCANLGLSPSANPIWPLNEHVQSPKIHHRLEDRCSHRRLDKPTIVVPAVSQQSLALSETPGSTRTSTVGATAHETAPKGHTSLPASRYRECRLTENSTAAYTWYEYTDSRHYGSPAPASVSLSPLSTLARSLSLS